MNEINDMTKKISVKDAFTKNKEIRIVCVSKRVCIVCGRPDYRYIAEKSFIGDKNKFECTFYNNSDIRMPEALLISTNLEDAYWFVENEVKPYSCQCDICSTTINSSLWDPEEDSERKYQAYERWLTDADADADSYDY